MCFKLLSILGLSVLILHPDFAAAEQSTHKLSLSEVQSLARESNKWLQSMKTKVEAVQQHATSQHYNWYPNVGVVFGGNALQAKNDNEIGGVTYGYVQYTIFDGGKRRLQRDQHEIQEDNLKKSSFIISNDLDTQVAHYFYRFVIYSKGVLELKTASKSMNELSKLAKRLSVLGALAKISLEGIELAEEQIYTIIEEVEGKALDARLDLRRFVDDSVISRIDVNIGDIPKSSNALISTPLATNADTLEAQMRYLNMSSQLELYKNSWLPEVGLKARYGRIPIAERYYNEAVQGEVLLTADWNFTNALQQKSEKLAILKEKNAYEAELDYRRKVVVSNFENLKEKLDYHRKRIEQIERFTNRLQQYFQDLKVEVNRGSLPVLEAKSTLVDYIEQKRKLFDERAAMWTTFIELDRINKFREDAFN